MKTIPRDVAQTMLNKLDQGLIRPIEVRRFAFNGYGVELKGATREQIARAICRHLRDSEAGHV